LTYDKIKKENDQLLKQIEDKDRAFD